jgi:hypothetical protein
VILSQILEEDFTFFEPSIGDLALIIIKIITLPSWVGREASCYQHYSSYYVKIPKLIQKPAFIKNGPYDFFSDD